MDKSHEALLNEYKGNIFEFLVAQKVATKFGVLGPFFDSINQNVQTMLGQQESYLRNYHTYLLTELPKLAELCADSIFDDFKHLKLTNCLIVGKVLGAANDNRYQEADLILVTDISEILISLKINRRGSYVNTKSAGIRSIFSKYFSKLDSKEIQYELDQFVDFEFETFSRKMHDEKGIVYTEGFKTWESYGLEVLPGQLQGRCKELLMEYYEKINDKIYDLLLQLYTKNEKDFLKSLFPLMGFSSHQIHQVTAFYELDKDKLIFHKMKIDIFGIEDIQKVRPVIEKKNKLIEVCIDKLKLQLRLKPMNKFTQKSFKVNCAIKKLAR